MHQLFPHQPHTKHVIIFVMWRLATWCRRGVSALLCPPRRWPTLALRCKHRQRHRGSRGSEVRRSRRTTLVSSNSQAGSTMKSSTPRDAVQLSPNAVTVLEKRYLVKDDGGKPVEAPSDLFWRVATTVAEADRKYGATDQEVEQLGEGVLRHHGDPALHAQLAHPDERRPPAGPALRLLRAAGGRRALQRQERHLRHAPRHGAGPPVGRRHRLLLLAAPAQERHRPVAPWAWPRARSPS